MYSLKVVTVHLSQEGFCNISQTLLSLSWRSKVGNIWMWLYSGSTVTPWFQSSLTAFVSGSDTKGDIKRSLSPGLELSSALMFNSTIPQPNATHNHAIIYSDQCLSYSCWELCGLKSTLWTSADPLPHTALLILLSRHNLIHCVFCLWVMAPWFQPHWQQDLWHIDTVSGEWSQWTMSLLWKQNLQKKKKFISDPFMFKLDKQCPGISPQHRNSTCNLTCHVSMEVE